MNQSRHVMVATLAAAVPESHLIGVGQTPINEVVYDSRLVRPGNLFAALVGADIDGHHFVPAAVELGAAALLVEREQEVPLPQIVVPDTRAALARVAATFHGHPSREIGVIGITGTDGKTTTSYLVDGILRTIGFRTGMIGTISVRVADAVDEHETRQTTPESADVQRYLRRMIDHGARWAVLEATSHGLPMHRLDDVKFAIAAVTNITHEHLDYHGSVAAYRRAKAILFERTAASGGAAVINIDDEGARDMLDVPTAGPVIRYSVDGQPAELTVSGITADGRGSQFTLATSNWGTAQVNLPLLGRFNIANAVCATGVALAAGVSLPNIVRALAAPPVIPGRMQAINRGQPFGVVVDYAHTPDSLAKVVTLLRSLHPRGRILTVFGSAGERDIEKRALMGEVATRLADFSVFTSEDPRNEDADTIIQAIAAGAVSAGGRAGETFATATDRKDAISIAFAQARPGDCILLAGKGHEGSIIWGREKVPWNEAAVATSLLAELGYAGDDTA